MLPLCMNTVILPTKCNRVYHFCIRAVVLVQGFIGDCFPLWYSWIVKRQDHLNWFFFSSRVVAQTAILKFQFYITTPVAITILIQLYSCLFHLHTESFSAQRYPGHSTSWNEVCADTPGCFLSESSVTCITLSMWHGTAQPSTSILHQKLWEQQ